MLFAPKEKGQGLVEYALILVLVAVVVIVILALLGPAIGNIFSNIYTNVYLCLTPDQSPPQFCVGTAGQYYCECSSVAFQDATTIRVPMRKANLQLRLWISSCLPGMKFRPAERTTQAHAS